MLVRGPTGTVKVASLCVCTASVELLEVVFSVLHTLTEKYQTSIVTIFFFWTCIATSESIQEFHLYEIYSLSNSLNFLNYIFLIKSNFTIWPHAAMHVVMVGKQILVLSNWSKYNYLEHLVWSISISESIDIFVPTLWRKTVSTLINYFSFSPTYPIRTKYTNK